MFLKPFFFKYTEVFSHLIPPVQNIATGLSFLSLFRSFSNSFSSWFKYVESILKADIPDLQTGVFLSLLDQDQIEGVTKNTEGWLENFRHLTTVS